MQVVKMKAQIKVLVQENETIKELLIQHMGADQAKQALKDALAKSDKGLDL
jgi:hypothetical protein